MNWTRTILDGLAMAVYFNLFAGFVALYRPRLMFPFGSALESCCLSFFMVRSALWRAGQPDSGLWL